MYYKAGGIKVLLYETWIAIKYSAKDSISRSIIKL